MRLKSTAFADGACTDLSFSRSQTGALRQWTTAKGKATPSRRPADGSSLARRALEMPHSRRQLLANAAIASSRVAA
jgi:hypothetical protein